MFLDSCCSILGPTCHGRRRLDQLFTGLHHARILLWHCEGLRIKVHCHLFDAIANRRPTRSYIHMREGPPAEDTICSRGCLFIVKCSIEGTSGTVSAVFVQCEPVVRSVDLHYPSTCTCSVQMSRYWSSCPPSLRSAYEVLVENIP